MRRDDGTYKSACMSSYARRATGCCLTGTAIRGSLGNMRLRPAIPSLLVVEMALGYCSIAKAEGADSNSLEAPAIAAQLVAEATRARNWRYVWTGVNAGSTGIALGAMPILPKSNVPVLAVSAVTTAISGAVTWFWPLEVESDAEIATQPMPSRPGLHASELRRLREHSASDEAARIRWPWHVVNLVVSLVPGAVLWFGFNRRTDATLASAGGFVTGEIQLFTQPTGLATGHLTSGTHLNVTSKSGIVTYGFVW